MRKKRRKKKEKLMCKSKDRENTFNVCESRMFEMYHHKVPNLDLMTKKMNFLYPRGGNLSTVVQLILTVLNRKTFLENYVFSFVACLLK